MLKLLRDGCRVITTSRFPHDAAHRYTAEGDSKDWSDRLKIFPLELKDANGETLNGMNNEMNNLITPDRAGRLRLENSRFVTHASISSTGCQPESFCDCALSIRPSVKSWFQCDNSKKP